MTTFWGAVIALGYFAVICLAVGLCRARSKPAPKPPRPTPPIHPTWADVHAKAAAIARAETYVTISPAMFARLRGIHGPEDQAAAVRELHELAQYESEFKS